jgi:hypothetical protein
LRFVVAFAGVLSCLLSCAAWSQDLDPSTAPQLLSGVPQPADPAPAIAALLAQPATNTVIGPLQLTTQVDTWRGQALVTAVLASTQVERQLLTMAAPSLALDAVVGSATAKGTIALRLVAAPFFSAVQGDLVAIAGNQSTPFKGEIDNWVATGEPVVGEFDQIIMADLSTRTTVRGFQADMADVAFISGSLSLYTLVPTQLSPVQMTPFDIYAGSVFIAKGAKITLTIPTTIESGAISLNATVSSLNTPVHVVSGQVASWPLPQPP